MKIDAKRICQEENVTGFSFFFSLEHQITRTKPPAVEKRNHTRKVITSAKISDANDLGPK